MISGLLALLAIAGRPSRSALSPVVPVSAMLLALLAWIFFQAAWPGGAGHAHQAWLDAAQVVAVEPTISITPADDWNGYLKIALPVAVFMISLLLLDTDERAMSALRLIGIGGGLTAVFSLVQFLAFPDYLLVAEKRFYRDSLTAPFVNRNTAAMFFGVVALLLLTILWHRVRDLPANRIFRAIEQGKWVSPAHFRQVAAASVYGVLLASSLIALVLTKSRAGIVASALMLIVLAISLLLLPAAERRRVRAPAAASRPRPGRRRVWIAVAVAALLAVVLVGMSGEVLRRMEIRSFTEEARFCVMPSIIRIIGDTFPRGSGLSSFSEIFRGYRPAECGILFGWNAAHNVYLEGLISLGLAFPLIVLFGLGYLLRHFVHGIRRRRRYAFAGYLGLTVLAATGIQAAVDFSVQVPGFAVLLAAVLGPVVTISRRDPNAPTAEPVRRGAAKPGPRSPLGAGLGRLAVLAAAVTCLWIAIDTLRAQREYGSVLVETRRLERGASASAARFAALSPKIEAIAENRVCFGDIVGAGLIVATSDLDLQNVGADFTSWSQAMGRAERYVVHALGCLPANGRLWLLLAMIRQQIAEQPAEIAALLKFSQRYAPAEEGVLETRFLLWNRLSATSLAAAGETLDRDLDVYYSDQGGVLRSRVPIRSVQLQKIIAERGLITRKP